MESVMREPKNGSVQPGRRKKADNLLVRLQKKQIKSKPKILLMATTNPCFTIHVPAELANHKNILDEEVRCFLANMEQRLTSTGTKFEATIISSDNLNLYRLASTVDQEMCSRSTSHMEPGTPADPITT